jgi:hypothetical protein
MAWDSSRPVPWRRLLKEWALYAAVMAVVFGLILRSSTALGSAIGLLMSLPVYLAFGAVLAKLGYQRPRLRRGSTATRGSGRESGSTAGESSTADRSAPRRTERRPAPTRRTSTGPSQHPRRTPKTRRR